MNDLYAGSSEHRLPFDYYLEAYRGLGPEEISYNLNIPYSQKEHYFLVTFFTEKYKIRYPQFSILPAAKIDPVISVYSNVSAKVILLRYLTEGTFRIMSGKMIPYCYLAGGDEGEESFEKDCVRRLAEVYAADPDGLAAYLQRLHAVPQNDGDYSCDIEIVPGVYIRFILTGASGGKTAGARILFSDNFPAAFSAEDAESICGIILDCYAAGR